MVFGIGRTKTKNIIAVKKFTLSLFVASLSVVSALAQSDSVLISKEQQGNKIVEKYLLPNADKDSEQFDVLFPINNAVVQQSFSDNSDTMAALNSFAEKAADTTMHILSVSVIGYASPDGIELKNSALAADRAKAVTTFLKSKCPKMEPKVSSKALLWSACVEPLEKSQLQNKEAVIAILNSTSHTELQKQAELEKMPQVWKYFKNTLLPAMRRVNINVEYGMDKYVEKVVVVTPPQPKPEPKVEPKSEPTPPKQAEKPYPVAVVETDETGIIVEVPQKEHRERKKR